MSRQNTSFVATKVCLSRQTRVCRDKGFVSTSTCLPRQKFCLDKHTFVATKVVFCQCIQKYACLDKIMFVATNICRDKSFVPTKMILVAAPASDSNPPPLPSRPSAPSRPCQPRSLLLQHGGVKTAPPFGQRRDMSVTIDARVLPPSDPAPSLTTGPNLAPQAWRTTTRAAREAINTVTWSQTCFVAAAQTRAGVLRWGASERK